MLASVHVLAAAPAGAQAAPRYDEPLFTSRDAMWMAGGALGATVLMFTIDRPIAQSFARQDTTGTANYIARRIAPFNEFKIFYGSLAVFAGGRILKRNRLADLGLHAAEAVVISRLLTDVVAGVAGRGRPRAVGADSVRVFKWGQGWTLVGYHAFPSRHATGAFSLAVVLDKEMERWWGPGPWYRDALLYSGATLVGLGRMYTGHHWASDVAAAAVVGVTTGLLVVRFNHRHPNNTVNRLLLGGARNQVGVSLPLQF